MPYYLVAKAAIVHRIDFFLKGKPQNNIKPEYRYLAGGNGYEYLKYCISCYFREGFIFANFASQTLAKMSTSIHVYL